MLAALAVCLSTAREHAHALVRSSDPEDGAVLQQAPAAVTIVFTETPDPQLSLIHVLNTSGRAVERGRPQPVSAEPLKLAVPLGMLPNGVYTVNWRTVSAVDGHVAGGSFAFGVGVSEDDVDLVARNTASVNSPSTPPPSGLGVGARWVFYVGLGVMVGAAWVPLLAVTRLSQGMALLSGLGVPTVPGSDCGHVYNRSTGKPVPDSPPRSSSAMTSRAPTIRCRSPCSRRQTPVPGTSTMATRC